MALSKVNTDSLVSVADAIRAKGGTSAPLSFPFGFVSAINDIETGGGGTGAEDGIIDRTISGEYTNSGTTQVGSYAFFGCRSLTSIAFLNATTVGTSAFDGCSSIVKASFPEVKTVGENAFRYCPLSIISFPKAQALLNNAFFSCSRATEAFFPNVSYFNDYAFRACFRLMSVYLPGTYRAGIMAHTFSSTPIAGYTNYTDGAYGSVFVPASLYDAYCSAPYWSIISERIVALTDEELAELRGE